MSSRYKGRLPELAFLLEQVQQSTRDGISALVASGQLPTNPVYAQAHAAACTKDAVVSAVLHYIRTGCDRGLREYGAQLPYRRERRA